MIMKAILVERELDSADFDSLRPISKLAVLFKLLENPVIRHLGDYFDIQLNYCHYIQVRLRPNYSTQTADLRTILTEAVDSCEQLSTASVGMGLVLSYTISAVNRGDFVGILLLLNS